jgi:hypothetical protein
MAWSPQARAAAIASRKAHAHGRTKPGGHPFIKQNGHHGIKGGMTQPVNQAGHRGQQVKRFAKTAAKVAAVGAVAGAAGYVAYQAHSRQQFTRGVVRHANRSVSENRAFAARSGYTIKNQQSNKQIKRAAVRKAHIVYKQHGSQVRSQLKSVKRGSKAQQRYVSKQTRPVADFGQQKALTQRDRYR